jgi:hypothetical protein
MRLAQHLHLGVSGLTAVRWVARVWAALLFVFWGAFFVAHLAWFRDPRGWPPPWVFALVGLHLAMLVGLLAGWRWELAGGLLVVVSAVTFFFFAAGQRFVPFALITATPGVLWIVLGGLAARARGRGLPPPPVGP